MTKEEAFKYTLLKLLELIKEEICLDNLSKAKEYVFYLKGILDDN
jgi:hypothetical protein